MRLALLGTLCISLTLASCFDPAGGSDTTEGSSGPAVTEDGPASCVPGQIQVCSCPEGSGNQVCNAEGSAYGACECPGESGETGPSSETGTTTSPADSSTGPTDSTGPDPGTTSGTEDSGTTMGLGETGSSSGGPPPGPLNVGDPCNDDLDCMTLVCWDFSDYDPLCFGTACSVTCMSDDECVTAMSVAGASNPAASNCGADGRCSTLGTGFGNYACAAPAR